MNEETASAALQAYESFASIYDDFNHQNDYELWIGATVLPRLRAYGLEAPGAALDVGCGTGKAFPPLLERGWEVRGCDISPAMVEIARERFGDEVRLSVADMRSLPALGSFELVLAINDAVNHLLTEGDLQRAMTGFAKNLAPGGLLVFDCNTRALFRGLFDPSVRHVVERGGRCWTWQGMGAGDRDPATFSAEISGDSIAPTTIVERHFSQPEVERALEAAGLRVRAVIGQREADGGLVLSEAPDEERDAKLLYVASAGPGPSPSVNP
jgi:SAM-dependent methyltransferase